MKYFMILLLVSVSFASLSAQNFKPAPSSLSAKVGTVTIAGKTFKGGESRTGSIFIMRVSKSGNEYKSYLGTPLKGSKYEGEQIFTANSKGVVKYFYFTINENTGYPKRNYLVAE